MDKTFEYNHSLPEENIVKKAVAYHLIKKIERENLILRPASEVYNYLSDYIRFGHPEYTADDIADVVTYAMQAVL